MGYRSKIHLKIQKYRRRILEYKQKPCNYGFLFPQLHGLLYFNSLPDLLRKQHHNLITSLYKSIPLMPYIFIISCIRRFSSDNVIIEAIFSSFNFSILTSSFSSPSSLRKISTRLSDVFWNASFSSSATSSFAPAVTSASILWNLMF